MKVIAVKASGKAFDVQDEEGKITVVNATRLLPLPPSHWRPQRPAMIHARDEAAFIPQFPGEQFFNAYVPEETVDKVTQSGDVRPTSLVNRGIGPEDTPDGGVDDVNGDTTINFVREMSDILYQNILSRGSPHLNASDSTSVEIAMPVQGDAPNREVVNVSTSGSMSMRSSGNGLDDLRLEYFGPYPESQPTVTSESVSERDNASEHAPINPASPVGPLETAEPTNFRISLASANQRVIRRLSLTSAQSAYEPPQTAGSER